MGGPARPSPFTLARPLSPIAGHHAALGEGSDVPEANITRWLAALFARWLVCATNLNCVFPNVHDISKPNQLAVNCRRPRSEILARAPKNLWKRTRPYFDVPPFRDVRFDCSGFKKSRHLREGSKCNSQNQ